MRKARLAGALLLAATQVAGCAPFVEVVKLDEGARAKARSDVKQYLAGEVPATSKVVRQLEATSCRLTMADPPATNEDAIDQLRFKAARLGANGITDVFCDSPGTFDLGKNCWSSIKCRGTAIAVSP
jgi:uncharacterized protein YbjQ (UPF0145 family)